MGNPLTSLLNGINPIVLEGIFLAALLLIIPVFRASRVTTTERTEILLTRAGLRQSARDARRSLSRVERKGDDGEPGFFLRTRMKLRAAGILDLTAAEYVAARILTAAILFSVVFFATSSVVLALIIGWLAFKIPDSQLSSRVDKINRLQEVQLRKACSRVVSSVEAGLATQEAIVRLGDVLEAPLGEQFARVARQVTRAGVPLEEALTEMERRIPTSEFKTFSTAIRVTLTNQVGIRDTMELLGNRLERRTSLRNEASASSRQMKGSYYFVLILIVLVGVYLFSNDPSAYQPLLQDPIGQMVTFFMVGMAYVGHRVIQSRSKLEAAL